MSVKGTEVTQSWIKLYVSSVAVGAVSVPAVAILMGMWWYLTAVSFAFLQQHMIMGIFSCVYFVICVSSLVECVFRFLAHF